jgi:hypothetical protein
MLQLKKVKRKKVADQNVLPGPGVFYFLLFTFEFPEGKLLARMKLQTLCQLTDYAFLNLKS